MTVSVDGVVLATGGGLIVIGAITRKLTPVAVGLSFLLTRAYVKWREGNVGTESAKTVRSGGPGVADEYTAGTEANARLRAAQDAWYQLHPEGPSFVNDDGTYNLPPGYTL